MTHPAPAHLGILGAVGAVALALAACGSSNSSSGSNESNTTGNSTPSASSSRPSGGSSAAGSASASSPGSGGASSSSSGTAASAPFGPGCSQVPSDPANPGSFAAMAKVPVATAASGSPLLSTMVTAVQAAGLVDTLNNAQDLTVFAPDNAAFAKVPSATLQAVLADKTKLTQILTYHVVPQRLAPEQLTGSLTSLEKAPILVKGVAPSLTVGPTGAEANVVCGNVRTSNATVYIIDSVLQPPS